MHPPKTNQQLMKTYSKNKEPPKRKRPGETTSNRPSFPAPKIVEAPPHLNGSIFNSDDSLRDDFWMDDFDHLLKGKTPLRKQKIIRKNVRADYNMDTSVEGSPMPLSSLIASRVEASTTLQGSPSVFQFQRPDTANISTISRTPVSRSDSSVDAVVAESFTTEDIVCDPINSSSNSSHLHSFVRNVCEDILSSSVKQQQNNSYSNSSDRIIRSIFLKRRTNESIVGSVESRPDVSHRRSDINNSNTHDGDGNTSAVQRHEQGAAFDGVSNVPSSSLSSSKTTSANNQSGISEPVLLTSQDTEKQEILFHGNESPGDFSPHIDETLLNSELLNDLLPLEFPEPSVVKELINNRVKKTYKVAESEEVNVGSTEENVLANNVMPETDATNYQVASIAASSTENQASDVLSKDLQSIVKTSKATRKNTKFPKNGTVEIDEQTTKETNASITVDSSVTQNKTKSNHPNREEHESNDDHTKKKGKKEKRNNLLHKEVSQDVSANMPSNLEPANANTLRESSGNIKTTRRRDRRERVNTEGAMSTQEEIHRSERVKSQLMDKSKQKAVHKTKEPLKTIKSSYASTEINCPKTIKENTATSFKKTSSNLRTEKESNHRKETGSKVPIQTNSNQPVPTFEQVVKYNLRNRRKTIEMDDLQSLESDSSLFPKSMESQSRNKSKNDKSNDKELSSQENLADNSSSPSSASTSFSQNSVIQNINDKSKSPNLSNNLLHASLRAIGKLKKLRRVKVKVKRLKWGRVNDSIKSLNASRLSILAGQQKMIRRSLAKFGRSMRLRLRRIKVAKSLETKTKGKKSPSTMKSTVKTVIPIESPKEANQTNTMTVRPNESDYLTGNLEIQSEGIEKQTETIQTENNCGENEFNQVEDIDSDDSSIDSLLDITRYSFLIDEISLRKSISRNDTSRAVMNPSVDTQPKSSEAKINLQETNEIIRKRKSRLAENDCAGSPEKVQILQVPNEPRVFKKVRVKLKRMHCLPESCKHVSENSSDDIGNVVIECNSDAFGRNIEKRKAADVNTFRLEPCPDASKEKLSTKSCPSRTVSFDEESSRTGGISSLENSLIDGTDSLIQESVRSSMSRAPILGTSSSSSRIDISSRRNSSSAAPTSDQSLQRSLDDSIDRDVFINNITRNATMFMNKSNQAAMAEPSMRLSLKNSLSRNCSSYIGRRSSVLAATIHEVDHDEVDMDRSGFMEGLVLPAGKWRQALSAWRKTNSVILDKTIVTLSANNSTASSINQSTSYSQRQQLKNCQNSPTTNPTYMLLSSRGVSAKKDNARYSNAGRESVVSKSFRHSNAKNRNVAFALKRPDPILEHSLIEKPSRPEGDQDDLLLLEPTDDGTPNLPSISLLESAIERNLQITSRSSQKGVEYITTTATTQNCAVDIVDSSNPRRSFNETSSNEFHRQLYQHQLSVPLYRQPSIPRRRRSSFIERCDDHSILPSPIPTSGGRQLHLSGAGDGGDEALNFTNYVHIPYERRILSASLNARDRVLRRCNQSEPLEFSVVYSENILRHCRKIGEGVYGEVFMNKTTNGDANVLKIIPIEGSIEVNGEPQKTFDQILSEIVIAMELSRLREDGQFMTGGFVEVKKICCVQGRYPDYLIDLWELYRDNCGTENDHPEIFPDDQLYIVLELANGGQDLEAFTFQNALQSYSAFAQTALTLAVAEQKFQFEHRDLHWGNILLAPTDDSAIIFRLNGKEIKVPSHGVKATIIDYTLSRMVYNGCCLYNDLSNDSELFLAGGDYQFDIYRFMKQHLNNQWTSFEPYTNILWLHYTIDKMISGARYRCSKSKKHRSAIQDMMRLRDELLDYKSASDYVECLK